VKKSSQARRWISLDATVLPWSFIGFVRGSVRSWFAACAFLISGALCVLVFRSGTPDAVTADPQPDGNGPVMRLGKNDLPVSKPPATARQPMTEKERSGLWNQLAGFSDGEAVEFLLSLPGRDLDVALGLASELGGIEGRQQTAREALRGLIGRDFEAAVAWGEGAAPSAGMELFWAAAADLTTGTNPGMALEFVGRTTGSLRLTLLENTFAEWAGEDPEAAKRAAMDLGTLEERSAAHVAILNSAREDGMERTLAWIESIGEPELQDALYYHAARDWAARDPGGAAGFAESLVESDYKTHLAGMVLESWVREDPASAMAWASRLKDQESREEAVSRGIRQTVEASPEQAATLALNLPGESERAAALEYVISVWIERNPDALAEWIGKVPDGVARARMSRMMEDHLLPGGN
jgi:hypothetical protein